jgi:hypothetical protein
MATAVIGATGRVRPDYLLSCTRLTSAGRQTGSACADTRAATR